MIWDKYAYLMLDSNIIEEEQGTSYIREEAFKFKDNPVIHEGRKEFFLGNEGYRVWIRNVCKVDGVYRMWYAFQFDKDFIGNADSASAKVMTGYAESTDGYEFKPIKVGTTEYNGSKNNNLVTMCPEGFHSMDVLHDPLDSEYPYKTVIVKKAELEDFAPALRARWPALHPTMELVWGIGKSKDGFNWEMPVRDSFLTDNYIEGPCLHRTIDGGMVIANQGPVTEEECCRRVNGWLTYDEQTAHLIPGALFEIPPHTTRIIAPQFGQEWHNTVWVQSHIRLVTARKGPSVVALHGFLYGNGGAETYAQQADIGLAVSSTGIGFRQVWPFRPFIIKGARGDWDGGLLAQAAMVETKDQTLFYCIASDTGNAAGTEYRAGVAYIDKDRFAYRVLTVNRGYKDGPKKREASIALKPIEMPDKCNLYLNVSHTNPVRRIIASCHDEAGKELEGFSVENCIPVTEPGLASPLRWKGVDTGTLSGKTVRIKLQIISNDCQYGDKESPRLYALYTRKPE